MTNKEDKENKAQELFKLSYDELCDPDKKSVREALKCKPLFEVNKTEEIYSRYLEEFTGEVKDYVKGTKGTDGMKYHDWETMLEIIEQFRCDMIPIIEEWNKAKLQQAEFIEKLNIEIGKLQSNMHVDEDDVFLSIDDFEAFKSEIDKTAKEVFK